MQCQCGNFFTPRYTKLTYSREDDMCDVCRGVDVVDIPLTVEELISDCLVTLLENPALQGGDGASLNLKIKY